jgi:anaerobic selenocysteine-containing dehydrogenase
MSVKTVTENGIVHTLCRQCDMRCCLRITIEDGKIKDIVGEEAHPQNRGRICHKGRAASDLVYHPDRLLRPLKRRSDGAFAEISYDQAMDEIAGKMREIKDRYGSRSMGIWKGEALGFFQQEDLARRFIHAFSSPNYFSNDSQCWNGKYIGYKTVQGYWNGCPDFANSGLMIFWGCNPPYSKPPLSRLTVEGREKGAKIIVIDPRLTPVGYKSDVYAQLLPGTDGALAWGLIHELIRTGSYDRAFVEQYSVGFDRLSEYANRFDPESAEKQTGVPREMIIRMAQMISENRPRVVNFVGNGLEHHENGINNIRAVACLGGLCGALDIQGGDPWPEGMGGRMLTLYDELPLVDQKPIGADRFPVLYQLRQECHTMTAMDYMLGKGDYPLRGLIITAANPVITNPNSLKVAKAFSSLDLLVVRELFLTETASLAHYVLPAATFLERSELHFHTNYQRVTLTTRALGAPGVVDEYTFLHDLAHRLGFGEKYFPWKNEDELNRWILEPTGISLEELKAHPEGITYKPIRYQKYKEKPLATPTGKFEFASQYLKDLGYPEVPEYFPPLYLRDPKPEYPLLLTTGARKYIYHHSRYFNIKRFRTAIPAPEVEIHPIDAGSLGVANGERVRVVSEMGSLEIQAKIVHEREIRPGILQITHGWKEANVNLITYDQINDPISGFPLLKAIPVRVEKI